MNISTVKTETGNVSCETPEGTVVHININQRSAFDCLLDTFRFFGDMKKSGEKTKSSSTPRSSTHLGFGVAYISLGLVSVMLAIIICIARPEIGIFYSGTHFWVGFPFIVSGILNLVAYKFPKKLWMALAFISILVDFGVSIGGMVVAVNDVQRMGWIRGGEGVCDNLLKGSNSYYYRTTAPPRYYNNYENDYNLSSCKDAFRKLRTFQSGLIIMTLLMMIWGVCLAILRVGCKVKSCVSSCTLERADNKDKLMKSDPSDNIIIA
ncbi:uncharacterized protein ACNLHF_019622 [Anomaloglossus baeobatrachus]|uniref:uncharacterized protein LOC142311181 n=1 Tax=Anomaloglossus baeobatrachus TaxID=238106 RepID=UPI003F505A31